MFPIHHPASSEDQASIQEECARAEAERPGECVELLQESPYRKALKGESPYASLRLWCPCGRQTA
ncbi:hypothetical protein EMIT0215P_50072 [Pseudomonas serboccidentalis]